MAHLRKQIRDNVVTALTGLSTTGSRVYASRVYPMAAANLPGLCVYAKSEEVETTTITRPRTQLRTLTLSVEGFAVATSGLDNTLDAISLEVEEALVWLQRVPVEYRRLLWFRAEGWSWRKLGRYFGCGSRQVRLRWRDGVVSLWERL